MTYKYEIQVLNSNIIIFVLNKFIIIFNNNKNNYKKSSIIRNHFQKLFITVP